MPKSKRNKVGESQHTLSQPSEGPTHAVADVQLFPFPAVNLTKAKKKDKQWKEGLITLVRNAVEE
jgi:hypothetical protein